jgi:hypothetical protein
MKKIVVLVTAFCLYSFSGYSKPMKLGKAMAFEKEILKEKVKNSKITIKEIKRVRVGNFFFLQITLSCTTLVWYQYTTQLGVFVDLVNSNPTFWLNALDEYACGSGFNYA